MDEIYIPPRGNGKRASYRRKRRPGYAVGWIRNLSVGFVVVVLLLAARWLVSDTSAIVYSSSLFPEPVPEPPKELTREEVAGYLAEHLDLLRDEDVVTAFDEKLGKLFLYTSLNLDLQQKLSDLLNASQAVAGAAVVVDPWSGQVLALSDFGTGDPLPVWAKASPAASVFKIVTAAAALEEGLLTPDSTIPYNGAKYTLYKGNLKQTVNKYSHYVHFDEAFGDSINTVFGKIGIHYTGFDTLAHYAQMLGFERELESDLPLETSHILQAETEFEVAELASGYNKRTKITPVHAALLPVTVLNDGLCPPVGVIREVKDPQGRCRYSFDPGGGQRALTEEAAQKLRILMQATIRKGTCEKAFRYVRAKADKGTVEVGGKTGYIGSLDRTLHYDWFTGYALDQKNARALCLAVLLVHGRNRAVRANRIAAAFMKEFLDSSPASEGTAVGLKQQMVPSTLRHASLKSARSLDPSIIR